MQGWTFQQGDKDPERKTTPHLVSWKDLPEDIREYDRETVRLIPELLKAAGYEALPMES